MPSIISIVYTPKSVERKPPDDYARVSLERATLIEGAGIDGDVKSGTKDRHLNVMAAEMIEQLRAEGFKTAPGQLGEQIVVEGIDVASLRVGDRLRFGESALIEVVIPRTGCARFEHIQGRPKRLASGRLGVMALVVTNGPIRVGDSVDLMLGET
jgi:MOSC domain-containing protein YiiM